MVRLSTALVASVVTASAVASRDNEVLIFEGITVACGSDVELKSNSPPVISAHPPPTLPLPGKDTFDTLNLSTWKHEITLSGGGVSCPFARGLLKSLGICAPRVQNWEFEVRRCRDVSSKDIFCVNVFKTRALVSSDFATGESD